MKFCPVFFYCIACKDHVFSQYNVFGRMFVTDVFFVELFNFIRYANNTTYDIVLKKAGHVAATN